MPNTHSFRRRTRYNRQKGNDCVKKAQAKKAQKVKEAQEVKKTAIGGDLSSSMEKLDLENAPVPVLPLRSHVKIEAPVSVLPLTAKAVANEATKVKAATTGKISTSAARRPAAANVLLFCRWCKAKDHLIEDCPKRCFRCDEFGHTHRSCPQNSSCNYCHSDEHQIKDCPLRCNTCLKFGRHLKWCTAFCRYCKAKDHNIATCPKQCNSCGIIGHRATHCPDREVRVKKCFLCQKDGHLKYECPYQTCTFCSEKGHMASNCYHDAEKGAMDKHLFARKK